MANKTETYIPQFGKRKSQARYGRNVKKYPNRYSPRKELIDC